MIKNSMYLLHQEDFFFFFLPKNQELKQKQEKKSCGKLPRDSCITQHFQYSSIYS